MQSPFTPISLMASLQVECLLVSGIILFLLEGRLAQACKCGPRFFLLLWELVTGSPACNLVGLFGSRALFMASCVTGE